MWIDPSNLTSQWQDSAGTTPVSTPGTVADSSNPVGLALDIRAGAPDTLGPELVTNGDFSDGTTGWTGRNGGTGAIVDGGMEVTSPVNFFGGVVQSLTLVVGHFYLLTATVRVGTAPQAEIRVDYGGEVSTSSSTNTAIQVIFAAPSATNLIQLNTFAGGGTAFFDNVSVREVPGNHLLQATSTARPLLSAYDGQTLGPGDTYPSTGFPIYQHYDGTDDGMATASFAAGTLTSAMDCLIAVRRDSAAQCVAGLYSVPVRSIYFGHAQAGSGGACAINVGTPTVWVDGVQLTGGTSVEPGTLNTALTVGEWHIMEFRGLDLSAITQAGWGDFGSGFSVTGARGDIMLYPSTASTEDKDKARQYLADKYGVTLA